MQFKYYRFFCIAISVIISCLMSVNAWSQNDLDAALQINVSGTRDDGQGFLSPNKVLAGDELQNKLGNTLG